MLLYEDKMVTSLLRYYNSHEYSRKNQLEIPVSIFYSANQKYTKNDKSLYQEQKCLEVVRWFSVYTERLKGTLRHCS
jgi:hypothetical protein